MPPNTKKPWLSSMPSSAAHLSPIQLQNESTCYEDKISCRRFRLRRARGAGLCNRLRAHWHERTRQRRCLLHLYHASIRQIARPESQVPDLLDGFGSGEEENANGANKPRAWSDQRICSRNKLTR